MSKSKPQQESNCFNCKSSIKREDYTYCTLKMKNSNSFTCYSEVTTNIIDCKFYRGKKNV